MVSHLNISYSEPEVAMRYSTDTSPRRCEWWSRPIVSFPTRLNGELTYKEVIVIITPFCCSFFTAFFVYSILYQRLDQAHCNAKFSIQSIVFSPSSATWHIDFLVQNPTFRYSIYYGIDETSVKLGDLNAADLKTFHERKSGRYTGFSMDFVAESNGNTNEVNFSELDIKLRATHKLVFGVSYNNAAHIDIKCQNLTRSHENVDKIQCYSSFTYSDNFFEFHTTS